jgi:ribosome-binding protein aMBF1 (putative translation factor)
MNKQEVNTLSDRLSHALVTLEISQAELARRINVKRQAVQYICTNALTKSKFAYDIAEALGINVSWLITGAGEMQSETTRSCE